MRISDWSSDGSSDLRLPGLLDRLLGGLLRLLQRAVGGAAGGLGRSRHRVPGFANRTLRGLRRLLGGGSGRLLGLLRPLARSEEHTSELQSLMRISYAVFCLKKKNTHEVMQT